MLPGLLVRAYRRPGLEGQRRCKPPTVCRDCPTDGEPLLPVTFQCNVYGEAIEQIREQECISGGLRCTHCRVWPDDDRRIAEQHSSAGHDLRRNVIQDGL